MAVWPARGEQEPALLGQLSLVGVFVVIPPASSRNLLANPFNCNCQLAWLGDWLRRRKIVTGNPRCQNPDFLRQIPLQDVAVPDFRCEEGNSWAPWAAGGWGEVMPQRGGVPWGGEALWRGWGEEQGDLLSPVPASAWWGLLRVIIRAIMCLLFKKWENMDKRRE